MVLAMKETGSTIKLTDTENYFMPMATFTKGSGEKIKPMEREIIFMPMVPNIQVIGKMISSMVLELRHGQMEQFMRVNIMRAKRTVKEN